MNSENIHEIIKQTLATQRYAVYNTVRNEQPHSALVSFAPTPDLAKIILLTPKNTRKYINTQINQKVNLFVTTSTNNPKDLETAITISVLGIAEVGEKIPHNLLSEYRDYFFEKNDFLSSIADKIDDIIVISVATFELTRNYQKSVIQTETNMKTLHIRQIPGTPVLRGLARGKALKVSDISEITKEHEDCIVLIDKIVDLSSIPVIKVKGFAVGESKIPSNLVEYLQKHDIPTVKNIGKELNSVNSGADISINGSLGVLILHEIKY